MNSNKIKYTLCSLAALLIIVSFTSRSFAAESDPTEMEAFFCNKKAKIVDNRSVGDKSNFSISGDLLTVKGNNFTTLNPTQTPDEYGCLALGTISKGSTVTIQIENNDVPGLINIPLWTENPWEKKPFSNQKKYEIIKGGVTYKISVTGYSYTEGEFTDGRAPEKIIKIEKIEITK